MRSNGSRRPWCASAGHGSSTPRKVRATRRRSPCSRRTSCPRRTCATWNTASVTRSTSGRLPSSSGSGCAVGSLALSMGDDRVHKHAERALQGNLEKERDKLARQNKMFVRDRLDRLLDPGSFAEDGLLANALADSLPADGVVTGIGRIDGRPVCVLADDPTVKAGSWGARPVDKTVRLTETALRHEVPVVYLVDSAGARITDQVELFPARRGAGRIFANEVRLSGRVPQVCCLFGPSAAGGAYIPAFCDVVFMVEGNASMYLGSPPMAEAGIGEHA